MSLPKYGSSKRAIPVLDHRMPVQNPASLAASGDQEDLASILAEISPPERARTIAGNNRLAVLALTLGEPPVPTGFVVPYVIDDTGVPLIGVRHVTNQLFNVDARETVSLIVAETPLTSVHSGSVSGVTITGKLVVIPVGDGLTEALAVYSRTQPSDMAVVRRGAGSLFRLAISAVLLTQPAGEVLSIAAREFAAASSDPLAAMAPGLMSHLSGDQSGSLVLLCRAFGGQPGASSAVLSGIDQHGLDVLVTTPQGRESVRLNFSRPVSSAEEVRRELSVMSRGARFKLGVG